MIPKAGAEMGVMLAISLHAVRDELRDDVRRVVLALRHHAVDAAALHHTVEPDPFEDLVDDLAEGFRDQPADEQDQQEREQLGHERGNRAPRVRDPLTEIDGREVGTLQRHRPLPGVTGTPPMDARWKKPVPGQ